MGIDEHLAWHDLGWAVAIAIIALALCAGLLIRTLLLRRLSRWASRTPWRIDETLIRSLRAPIVVWSLLLGIHVAAYTVQDLPQRLVDALHVVLLIAAVVSITLWLGDLAARALTTAAAREGSSSIRATGLMRNLVRAIIVGIGLLVLLSTLGISVAPILTGLGIGGLAVALALQSTLANVFAGLHLMLSRHVRIGDRVRLETRQEGEVEDIGWGVSRVRTTDGDEVVLPNSRLAASVVLIRSHPGTTGPRAGGEQPRAAHRRPVRRSRAGRTAGPGGRTRTSGR